MAKFRCQLSVDNEMIYTLWNNGWRYALKLFCSSSIKTKEKDKKKKRSTRCIYDSKLLHLSRVDSYRYPHVSYHFHDIQVCSFLHFYLKKTICGETLYQLCPHEIKVVYPFMCVLWSRLFCCHCVKVQNSTTTSRHMLNSNLFVLFFFFMNYFSFISKLLSKFTSWQPCYTE